MQPTMELRFVERDEESNLTADGHLLPHDVVRVIKRRVLQQKWNFKDGIDREGWPHHGEWRDVPLQDE
jgi:hypothetical protein